MTESRVLDARGGGERTGGWCLMGPECLGRWKHPGDDGGDGCTTR